MDLLAENWMGLKVSNRGITVDRADLDISEGFGELLRVSGHQILLSHASLAI